MVQMLPNLRFIALYIVADWQYELDTFIESIIRKFDIVCVHEYASRPQ